MTQWLNLLIPIFWGYNQVENSTSLMVCSSLTSAGVYGQTILVQPERAANMFCLAFDQEVPPSSMIKDAPRLGDEKYDRIQLEKHVSWMSWADRCSLTSIFVIPGHLCPQTKSSNSIKKLKHPRKTSSNSYKIPNMCHMYPLFPPHFECKKQMLITCPFLARVGHATGQHWENRKIQITSGDDIHWYTIYTHS